jgi:transcriptional regulator with XRE-family HTH domain
MNLKKTFGERIRARRAKLAMSKTALSVAVGVSTVCAWQWENDQTEPKGENLVKLSDALGCNIKWLIEGRGLEEAFIDERYTNLLEYFSRNTKYNQDAILTMAKTGAALEDQSKNPDISKDKSMGSAQAKNIKK